MYSATLAGAILRGWAGGGGGRRERGGLPCPYLKIEESFLILERKILALVVSIFGLHFAIKYGFNSNSEASFSCVFNKTFIEMP